MAKVKEKFVKFVAPGENVDATNYKTTIKATNEKTVYTTNISNL